MTGSFHLCAETFTYSKLTILSTHELVLEISKNYIVDPVLYTHIPCVTGTTLSPYLTVWTVLITTATEKLYKLNVTRFYFGAVAEMFAVAVVLGKLQYSHWLFSGVLSFWPLHPTTPVLPLWTNQICTRPSIWEKATRQLVS